MEGNLNVRSCGQILILFLLIGCAGSRSEVVNQCPVLTHPSNSFTSVDQSREPTTPPSTAEPKSRFCEPLTLTAQKQVDAKQEQQVFPAMHEDPQEIPASPAPNIPPAPPELIPSIEVNGETSPLLSLDDVISSVIDFYPSLEAAFFERGIAAGNQLSSEGEFDLKLKAASENGPTGFYRNYRQSLGLVQPLYQGGEIFAGYRIGRGTFEPWYKERQTNEGGEFKAGVAVPLARNRNIDERRAGLWRSTYERQIVEPEIQAQLIEFIQQASFAYWDWVAAGENYRVAKEILDLAEDRTERIRSQVKNGFLDPPELTDNLRLVAERKAKFAEASQKLQKGAIKLSLYYRDETGQPMIPSPSQLPPFPAPGLINPENVVGDSQLALQQRPEIAIYQILQRQLEVDYAQAHNSLRPEIDAILSASQDVGIPTSKKNDKGEFELDASLFVDIPIQRRKARGKLNSIHAKMSQLQSKRRMTEDKIVAEVQTAYAVMIAAFEQVQQTQQAVTHAEDLAQRERRNFEEGASDLLKVTLREQYAVESRLKSIDSLEDYFRAQADYRAVLAQDQLPSLPE